MQRLGKCVVGLKCNSWLLSNNTTVLLKSWVMSARNREKRKVNVNKISVNIKNIIKVLEKYS